MESDPLAEEQAEEVRVRAEALARDHTFADLFLHTLATAVRIDPDGVRAALVGLLDLRAWSAHARDVRTEFSRLVQLARETKELLAAVRQDFEQLEADFDRLRFEVEEWERKHPQTPRTTPGGNDDGTDSRH